MSDMPKNEEEWKKKLTPEQYAVLRKKGTEVPFTGKLLKNKESGEYMCAACGAKLFASNTKFDSGTGWPSFYDAEKSNVELKSDNSLFMQRTEVLCKNCGSHLGHLFDDGPAPTGKRYCINSVCLNFKSSEGQTEKATFAAGCFWGIQEEFDKLPGVISTMVGYTGGTTTNPSYQQVCSNTTGHAESVLVEFDPKKISYEQLLNAFWDMHDPTQVNRQGPDVGEQYRSTIFYHNDKQKELAEKSLQDQQKKLSRKIATQILPAKDFYNAEEYHQKYYMKH